MKPRDYMALLIVAVGFLATGRIFPWGPWVDKVPTLGTAGALALFLLPAAYIASPENRSRYGEKWLWAVWFCASLFVLMECFRE